MAKLISSAIASVDSFVENADGGFDWAAPDDEVHRFVNELERSVGTNLQAIRAGLVDRLQLLLVPCLWAVESPLSRTTHASASSSSARSHSPAGPCTCTTGSSRLADPATRQ